MKLRALLFFVLLLTVSATIGCGGGSEPPTSDAPPTADAPPEGEEPTLPEDGP